jgi:hypothetical protein
MNTRLKNLLLVSALIFLTGCALPGSLRKIPKETQTVSSRDTISLGNSTHQMSIQYLGAGGLYLLNDGEGILIDPFFTNPKLFKVGTSLFLNCHNFRSKPRMVSYGLDAINTNRQILSEQVEAIFVSHSHYDHLMDVPAVFDRLDKKPIVYLNRSGYNTCYKLIDTAKMMVLEDHMASQCPGTASKPIILKRKNGFVYVYPILADHNPHFKHLKAFDGDITIPDINKAPGKKTKGNDWLEGNTYSFIIDYMKNDTEIELRLFIQSSSCNPPAGFPTSTIPKHPVDIAILGVASYQFSPLYPAKLLDTLKPQKLVWIHWEDFFRKYSRKPKTVRATDIRAFFEKTEVVGMRDSSYVPWPRAVLDVRY